VSPSTLHAYLAVVRMGLRGYQLQRSAREVIASLAQLQADVQTLRSELDTAIRQANYSLANLREAEGALVHVEQRLAGIAMLGGEQHSGQIGGGAAER
jgi:DNA anti-recombination protein RmuC